MMDADLLAMLRCPQTRQRLTMAGPELLAMVNARTAGTLQAALVREDGTVLYPICDGIPVLLAEKAVSVQPD